MNNAINNRAPVAAPANGRQGLPIVRGSHLLALANILVCLFLVAPILVVIVTSFSADQFMQFPPSGWSLRWYRIVLEDEKLLDGLKLSAILAVFTGFIAGTIGTLAAYAMSQHRTRYTGFIETMHTAPLVTPGVVTGLAMLIFFSDIGMRGSFLVLLAGHVVLSIPFVVMIVAAGLKSFDRSIENAALSLGASRPVAFLTVTMPVIKTSVISASAFAFLHSLDEVVVTLFLPGPRTKTLPVVMFDHIQHNLDPLPAAVSTVLIGLAALSVFMAARFGMLGRFIGDR